MAKAEVTFHRSEKGGYETFLEFLIWAVLFVRNVFIRQQSVKSVMFDKLLKRFNKSVFY